MSRASASAAKKCNSSGGLALPSRYGISSQTLNHLSSPERQFVALAASKLMFTVSLRFITPQFNLSFNVSIIQQKRISELVIWEDRHVLFSLLSNNE